VIDLSFDENAQEIFETLNARGAQLTPADLIKNFVFQKLLVSGGGGERAMLKSSVIQGRPTASGKHHKWDTLFIRVKAILPVE
jgi:hypothetical protein